ncbi:MAG TPA: peroxiredoxin family protein [Flavobacteriales bacterium]|nr:peroxiredoxin family protein [Flavobacteriales bacterium]
MFKNFHPLSTLGAVVLALSPVFFFSGQSLLGVGLLFAAHGFALLEFKKYTSQFQFALMLITAVAMGVVLDLEYMSWPLLTIGLLLAATASIARQAFMQQFTYVNLLWVDTGLSLVALACYLIAITTQPFAWDLWLGPLLPIGFALGLTFSYVQDAMQMRKRTRFGYRVTVGQPAPEFTLPDSNGAMVSLSDYKGKHPLLLVFVRGDWCPGCHMMLRTYERERERFLEKGVHVLGIGPDDISVNRDMVQRIGVAFKMLSDDVQAVSGQYGVVYNNPIIEMGIDYAEGIPLPASFLVDIDGVVRYVSRPDRVGEFLDPQLIFGVLGELPTTAQPAWS